MKIFKTALVILGWFILLWAGFIMVHVAKIMGTWIEFPTVLSGVILYLGTLLLACYIIIDKIWKKKK